MNGTIGLDTNIFIYYFQQNEAFGERAKTIFGKLEAGKKKAITSIIALIELLSLKLPDKDIALLQDAFLQTPNLDVYDVTRKIGLEASRIRRTYGFRLPDSIQLATALLQKANVFITNDVKIQKFKEIDVALLKDF